MKVNEREKISSLCSDTWHLIASLGHNMLPKWTERDKKNPSVNVILFRPVSLTLQLEEESKDTDGEKDVVVEGGEASEVSQVNSIS